MNFKAAPILLALLTGSAFASEGAYGAQYTKAPPPVINFIEAPLSLKYPSTKDALVIELSVREADKLLASDEGHLWAPFGAVAPKCDAPPKKEGNSKADQVDYSKAVRDYKENCLKVKKLCNQVTNFGKRHGIISTCSPLYQEAKVFLTTAEQADYVNPYEGDLDLPEFEKTPIK